MATRAAAGEARSEMVVDGAAEEPLPPGTEHIEEEEGWPEGIAPEMVAYARELAVSREQVAHWVHFLSAHPEGQQVWEEIRPLWKPPRRRAAQPASQAKPRKR